MGREHFFRASKDDLAIALALPETRCVRGCVQQETAKFSDDASELIVVENFFEELKAKVGN